jgi:tetratricopeptide (TPR) repeat protein
VRRVVAIVLALAWVGAASAARGEDLAEAKARFKRGVDLYKDRRWKEAMEEFEAAYRAKPHGALHFNVAQCRERLDDWPGAIRSYHDYLRELPAAPDKDAVRGAMRRLEERLALSNVQVLLLDSTPPGARVVVEGLERGKTPLHLVLQPATYDLTLSLDGHAPWTQRVAVGGGVSVVVDVALTPVPLPAPPPGAELVARPRAEPPRTPPLAPAPPPRPRQHLPAWIAAGAAVAATVAAVAYGASARADARAIDGLSAPDGGAATRRARSAESKARTANVLYGLGGGAAAASAGLFLLEGRF